MIELNPKNVVRHLSGVLVLSKRANDYAGFLHDGRARSIGRGNLMAWGEAEFSRHAYKALSKREKHDLLEWLNQL